MPWQKVLPMDERMRFISRYESGVWSMSELCRQFGISRKTGYKWLGRYRARGYEGLGERSHRPHESPTRVSEQWVERLVEMRVKHPTWGPKKLRIKLLQKHGNGVPAASTLGKKLKQLGMVRARKRRWPAVEVPRSRQAPTRSNEVWGVDFKGWFRLGDGSRCDPLTISDLYSRYVLCCEALGGQSFELVRPVFEKIFQRHGMPERLRMDNGTPFASTGVGRFSRMSLWWKGLGITLEYIEPGCPEQNGVHERMHRTLKAEATKPPADTMGGQQRRFDQWREQFNQERPHEALGQRVPAILYERSERAYTGEVQEARYGLGYALRRVRSNGQIKWCGQLRFISETLSGELVAVREREAERYEVWYREVLLGQLVGRGKEKLEAMERRGA